MHKGGHDHPAEPSCLPPRRAAARAVQPREAGRSQARASPWRALQPPFSTHTQPTADSLGRYLAGPAQGGSRQLMTCLAAESCKTRHDSSAKASGALHMPTWLGWYLSRCFTSSRVNWRRSQMSRTRPSPSSTRCQMPGTARTARTARGGAGQGGGRAHGVVPAGQPAGAVGRAPAPRRAGALGAGAVGGKG